MTVRLLTSAEVKKLERVTRADRHSAPHRFFVRDAETVRRIARESHAKPDDVVLEIGAGLGTVTLGLLERHASVIAVESDDQLAQQLPVVAADHTHSEIHRLTVYNADTGALRPEDLPAQPTIIVANFPGAHDVDVLPTLLGRFPTVRSVILLGQSRAVSHLLPGSGTDHEPLALKLAFFGRIRNSAAVSPSELSPRPRAGYALARLDRKPARPWPSDDAFRRSVFALIDIAFSHRRRSARTAFAQWAGCGAESARRLLAASIDPARPAETLDIEDFVRLQRRWETLEASEPGEHRTTAWGGGGAVPVGVSVPSGGHRHRTAS